MGANADGSAALDALDALAELGRGASEAAGPRAAAGAVEGAGADEPRRGTSGRGRSEGVTTGPLGAEAAAAASGAGGGEVIEMTGDDRMAGLETD